MIGAWFRSRLAREQAKLIYQNSSATVLLPFFMQQGMPSVAVELQEIEENAKQCAALQKPLINDVADRLIYHNKEFRRYHRAASKARGVHSSFDRLFRPPTGWAGLYRQLGL